MNYGVFVAHELQKSAAPLVANLAGVGMAAGL